jgi:adenylate cyclase
VVMLDIVGYSRLVGLDEAGTLSRIQSWRDDVVEPLRKEHSGTIVKSMGDGLLMEFGSALGAVEFAAKLQDNTSAITVQKDGQPLCIRIGINVGDVFRDSTDIYGDGVNVAARLESMCDPGGILISHAVWESIQSRTQLLFHDNGDRKFKNITRAIRVWSWPRKMLALREDGKPGVFIAQFTGRSKSEIDFAADLSVELALHLTRLTGLRVEPFPTESRYRLEGECRTAGSRIRTTWSLTAPSEGRLVWSDRVDIVIDDLFEALDASATKIAMAARRVVASDDAERIASRPLDELSFEQLLAVAGVSFFTPTKDGWLRGGRISEQALELNPQSFMALAMAAAGLGLAEELYGFRRTADEIAALALKRIDEAIRINNRSDMVHITRAGLLLYHRRGYRGAITEARSALALNPDFNMALWMLGAAQVFSGDQQGVYSVRRAVEINRRDPYVHLFWRIEGYGHFASGKYEEAIDSFTSADAVAPGLPPNMLMLAATLQLAGEEALAGEMVQRIKVIEPDFTLDTMNPPPFANKNVAALIFEALTIAGAPARHAVSS